ncbi:T-lymphoma invasion and metastasis-inducing protein 1-like [Seriola lalandi dorsalis]|uniref:T-lymphoma invasion and metastasis-inducing protein 1-like n=1 Tax=Seriola lalandi dorsalis TaxID=1841481 RepID=UPI000C6F8FAC|nr:T-lymphoma invasion and metastasis-inducing protein 1-like [Seriola lalandi dorsalis]
MGNVESQNGDSGFYGDVTGQLSRKHTSRSLRLSSKQPITRRSRHSSSVKQEHRNSEASTRSSSTPSIPQSLAENGLEPFNATDAFGEFGINPHWTQRVAMTMRPESYQQDDDPLATPTPETSEADTVAQDGGEDSMGEGEGDTVGEERYLQRMTEGPREGGSFKKKRSKSADMWREDSLEFSLSDLSQEHLTSTEEMVDGGEEEEEEQFTRPSAGSAERASSLDHLCSQQSPGLRGQRSRYAKNRREAECDGDGEGEEGLMSPTEEDGGGYGAFTLPCRRSHCLSEGLAGLGIPAAPCPAFQGRRAQTTQDISGVLGEGSEYGDSGIDGVTAEIDGDGELVSRRCKAMSASFSVYSATESSVFNGSDSGSSSAGGGEGRGGEGGRGGVYENFRKELDNQAWTHQGRDCTEEAGSAVSDEQSSGTLSSAYPSDTLIGCAQGTVRKAGALAVKNFLVHKKNKKVEPATRRKWKHYWVSLKECSIFLWEQNLERFHMDLFRCRCYLASLQGGEPPNPKRLLGFASRPTKLAMGRLGIFSVSSFHALVLPESLPVAHPQYQPSQESGCVSLAVRVSARTESSIRRRSQAMPRTFSKRRSRFSSLWGLDTASKRKTKGHPSINQVFVDGMEPVRKPLELMFEDSASEKSKERESSVKSLPQQNVDTDIWVPDYLTPSWVCLPNNQPVLAIIQPGETALEVLSAICKTHKIDPSSHYLRLKVWVENQMLFFVPKLEDDISDLLYKEIEICPKVTKVIQFDNTESCTIGYGFSVAVIDEDGTQQLHITEVKAGGLAAAKGLKAGDEILLLNGKPASALQMDDMRAAFVNQALTVSISTLPQLDPRVLCSQPRRRSDAEQDPATDIFSQSQGYAIRQGSDRE